MSRKLCGLALLAVVSGASAASSPHPVARIPTGLAPCGATAAFGAVWVANDGSGTLARIDPRTNRVTRRVNVKRGACSVAAGAGAVWVTNYREHTVVRVRPRGGARSVRVDAVPFDVLVAYGRVWVTGWQAGRLDELDPRTLRVVRRLDIGPYPAGLAARGGAVWVGFGRDATAIARVDPASGTIERVPVGDSSPSWFAAGTRDLWVQANDRDLVHVDASARRALGRLRVGRTLARARRRPTGRSGYLTRSRASSTGSTPWGSGWWTRSGPAGVRSSRSAPSARCG